MLRLPFPVAINRFRLFKSLRRQQRLRFAMKALNILRLIKSVCPDAPKRGPVAARSAVIRNGKLYMDTEFSKQINEYDF